MPESIDWKFIANEEGEMILKGYGRERNYRNYATWLVMNADQTGILKAEAR